MKNNKLHTACKIGFIIVFLLTFLLWCVLLAGAVQHDQHDDILGASFTVEIGLILLFVAVAEEFTIYRCVRYFLLGQKTTGKTIRYALLLILASFLVILEIFYFLPYF